MRLFYIKFHSSDRLTLIWSYSPFAICSMAQVITIFTAFVALCTLWTPLSLHVISPAEKAALLTITEC